MWPFPKKKSPPEEGATMTEAEHPHGAAQSVDVVAARLAEAVETGVKAALQDFTTKGGTLAPSGAATAGTPAAQPHPVPPVGGGSGGQVATPPTPASEQPAASPVQDQVAAPPPSIPVHVSTGARESSLTTLEPIGLQAQPRPQIEVRRTINVTPAGHEAQHTPPPQPQHALPPLASAPIVDPAGARGSIPVQTVATVAPPQVPELGEPMILIGNPKLPSTPRDFPRVAATAADSMIDGGTVNGLTVRAASLRGDDHRWNCDPRQDAFGVHVLSPVDRPAAPGEPELLVCVADGVGSQTYSHIGSRLVCEVIAHAVTEQAASLLDPAREAQVKSECVDLMDRLATRLEETAAARGVPAKSLSTTLVAAVIGGGPGDRQAAVFGVGDSPSWVLRGGEFYPVLGDADSPEIASTRTDALPSGKNSVVIKFIRGLKPGDMLLLCTDGLGNPMRDKGVRDQLAAWWGGPNVPGLPQFYWQMSFRAQTYGDDRTAVCVWVA